MTTTIGSLDLNAFSDLYSDSNQYFWFESNASATYGAGVHVTLSPDTSFIANPTGQNILMNTDGISIRNGLLPMMVLDNDSLDFNTVDTTAGTYTTTATFSATSAQIGQSDGAHFVIDANGQRFYVDGTTEVASFGAYNAFIGQFEANRVSMSPSQFQIVSNGLPAFSIQTYNEQGNARVLVYRSANFSSGDTISVSPSANYSDIPNGTEITYRILRQFYYDGVPKGSEYYDFIFNKGTSKTVTIPFDFVVENASSIDDTVSLNVTIHYESYNGDIRVTAPAYYAGGTGEVYVAEYYNGLSSLSAYAYALVDLAELELNGVANIYGSLNLEVPVYDPSNVTVREFRGAIVTGETTSGSIVTFTAESHDWTGEQFIEGVLAVIYLDIGHHFLDSSTSELRLDIDGTGALPVYYNGQIVSGTNNPFSLISYVGLYYDPSNNCFEVFYSEYANNRENGGLMYYIASAGMYPHVINKDEMLNSKLLSMQTLRKLQPMYDEPTISVTTGTIVESVLTMCGNVITLTLGVRKSTATPVGQNVFVGNLDGIEVPKYLVNGVGYAGSSIGILQLLGTGAITIRIAGAQLPANTTIYVSATYISSEYSSY